MDDLWVRVNNDIPKYMYKICKEYNLCCIKISRLETALLNDSFALVIGIDRFFVTVDYVSIINEEIVVYNCDRYFAKKYDENDRINLLPNIGADNILLNNLIVIANGLYSKWGNVLKGNKDWLDDYLASNDYSLGKLSLNTIKILKKYLKINSDI